MDAIEYYPLLTTINLAAALAGVYYGSRLYNFTKGATDFWMFLTAFIFSLGMYTFFDFLGKVVFTAYYEPIKSIQDISIAFASVLAVLSALYAKKMFDQLFED